MPALAQGEGAGAAPTLFVEVGGRKLAYRSVGKGKPIVLAHRFRGVLDLWDPAFIDALAAHGSQVVTFDHSGLGLSTGERSYNPASLVKDTKELIDALGLKDVVIGGWRQCRTDLRGHVRCQCQSRRTDLYDAAGQAGQVW